MPAKNAKLRILENVSFKTNAAFIPYPDRGEEDKHQGLGRNGAEVELEDSGRPILKKKIVLYSNIKNEGDLTVNS